MGHESAGGAKWKKSWPRRRNFKEFAREVDEPNIKQTSGEMA